MLSKDFLYHIYDGTAVKFWSDIIIFYVLQDSLGLYVCFLFSEVSSKMIALLTPLDTSV